MDSTNTSTTNVSAAASKINNEGEGGNLITDLINNLQIENEDNFDRWKLEEVLLKELSSLETANIDAVVTTDSQVNQILNGVDKTLEALDLVDSWLTVYKTELDGLSDDIFQIQTLNEMLQVQSKNQLDLLKELELVLGKTAVPNDLSDVLGKAHFDSEAEMKSIMLAAASLQRCLKTKYDDGTASMKAVNEQIDLTSLQSSNFSTRCFEYLKVMFAFQVDTSLNGAAKGGKLRIDMKSIKQELCKYRGLTLWLREMDPRRHAELQVSYTGAISKIYSSEYRHLSQTFQSLASIRKSVRSEGANYLFSHDSSNRSKLGPSLHKRSNSDLASDNRTPPEIVIGQVLNIVIPDVIKEQNFFCLLFHIGLNPDSDFQTFVDNLAENTTLSDSDLFDLKNISKDIRIRKKLSENMTRMFDILPQELAELSEMLNHQDPTLLIPLLTKLELFLEKTQDTNQEFLFSILQSLVKRSRDQFDLFIEEQVRAIKDSHLTVKKRSGILSFFRPFPVLLGRLENFLGNSQSQIRDQVNKAYKKIILVMFENLEASARASEAGGHDEKEQLNLHVITLENMHHFYSETRGFNKNPIISQFNKQSKEAYEHHLNLYTQNIINRPLKRLQEFFDGIESLLKSTSAEEVTYHVSYNKQSLKSIIKTHPAEDIRKGIHNMYKRVLKHMGEEERLLQVVWRNIQQSFLDEYTRYTKLIATCYGESNIQFEFSVNDLLQYFSNATR